MDPLSDVLRAVRLTGAFFYVAEATEPWSLSVAPARELAPRPLPAAEHLMAYHIMTSGTCWVGVEGEEQVLLQPGDAIVFPHGDAHHASSAGPAGPAATPRRRRARSGRCTSARAAARAQAWSAASSAATRGPTTRCSRRCRGACTCRGIADGWLAEFPRQVVAEAWQGRAGGETMLRGWRS